MSNFRYCCLDLLGKLMGSRKLGRYGDSSFAHPSNITTLLQSPPKTQNAYKYDIYKYDILNIYTWNKEKLTPWNSIPWTEFAIFKRVVFQKEPHGNQQHLHFCPRGGCPKHQTVAKKVMEHTRSEPISIVLFPGLIHWMIQYSCLNVFKSKEFAVQEMHICRNWLPGTARKCCKFADAVWSWTKVPVQVEVEGIQGLSELLENNHSLRPNLWEAPESAARNHTLGSVQ